MPNTVDSYRFISGITKRMINNWIKLEKPRPIPWTPLTKPLSECTVALLSTAGIALKTDLPFDQETERKNPWWGDPSYRSLPKDATEKDVRLYHMHVDPAYALQDLNCLFPLQRLQELENKARIGRVSPRHYSLMGYILNPKQLLQETVPALIRSLKEDLADVVVLVPAWPVCCWSVGLVQRELEAAGFTTICLTPVPDLTASVSVPRLAAIEYPLGRTLGQPGDSLGQMAVLEATLHALETIQTPGGIMHLPFEWQDPRNVRNQPPVDPPIGRYLMRNPWFLPRLLTRDIPG